MPNHLSRSKRPRDLNQLAKFVVDLATSDPIMQPLPVAEPTKTTRPSSKPVEREKNPNAVALGKLGGSKGGKAAAEKMSPQERSARAKAAALARWKRKEKGA